MVGSGDRAGYEAAEAAWAGERALPAPASRRSMPLLPIAAAVFGVLLLLALAVGVVAGEGIEAERERADRDVELVERSSDDRAAAVPTADEDRPTTTEAPPTTEPPTTTSEAPTTTVTPVTAPPPPPVVTSPPATRPPVTSPPPPPPTTAAPAPSGGCHPSYTPCVPTASDVDCAGGGGNGPAFVSGPVQVHGPDEYDLDRDDDGVGCES